MAENAQHDVESASAESKAKDLQYKRRMKRLYCVAAVILFLTVVILVLSLIIMRVKSPEFRLRSITIEELTVSSSNTNNNVPSIDMKFEAEIGIKNTNFGHYKFDESSVNFFYRETQVGHASVDNESVKARSTKNMDMMVEVRTTNPNLASDIGSGSLTLTSQAKLNGTVYMMKLSKRKRSAEMNCTITVDLKEKEVRDLKCT